MPQVKHYGIFQFKEDVTPEQIDHCFGEMKGMVGNVPGVLEVLHGPYDGPEGLNEGFTHGFVMTFESPETRDAYLPHPEHELVKDVVIPCLEKVIVFDFNV